VTRFFKSVSYAANGFSQMLKTERNVRIQLALAVLILLAGLLCGLGRMEWALITFCVGLVFVAEALNTAIEKLADALHPGLDPKIALVKDLAAAAVLIAAVSAGLVGILVFLPHLI
jgi:diacylglycerol kinase